MVGNALNCKKSGAKAVGQLEQNYAERLYQGAIKAVPSSNKSALQRVVIMASLTTYLHWISFVRTKWDFAILSQIETAAYAAS